MPPNASQAESRRAYRKAAKETHPDLNPGKPEAEKRFKEVNAAYEVIGDADKRRRYDAGEIDKGGAERKPERHFYRDYAETDQNPRYSGARRTTNERMAGGDFKYDVFAEPRHWQANNCGTVRLSAPSAAERKHLIRLYPSAFAVGLAPHVRLRLQEGRRADPLAALLPSRDYGLF